MNARQRHLPLRTRLVSSRAISVAGRAARTAACREVGEELLSISFGGGASLAASANGACSREQTNAGQVRSSRRGEGVSNGCMSAASSALEAFGDSCRLRTRFALRHPGKSQSQRRTPNQALQRTATLAFSYRCPALTLPAQSRPVLPAMKPGTGRAFASRRRAHSRAPGPESLSLGSLGVARAHRK